MNFDIKDVKSWANRHDVKVGDEGYFFDDIRDLEEDGYSKHKGKIIRINDNYGFPFLKENIQYCFFLPLDAVKEDKPKEKYRPFKTMRELTEVVRGKDWEMNDITTGDELMIRSKGDEDRHRRVLITDLTLDNDCNLIFINNETMTVWLDNYEVMSASARDWVPFGVEVKEQK